jgi:hypothetical protein
MNEREVLIEATCSPYRERDAFGRILAAPAFRDLSPADRETAFDAQLSARAFERAVAADGLSGTARAVLARAVNIAQLGTD